MEYNGKEIILHIRKQSVPTIIIFYDTTCEHPFVFGTFLVLILLYIYLPSLFYLIAYFSPALICAILLLGVILTYSEPNISEEQEQEQKHEAYNENSYNVGQNDQELSYEYETSTDEELEAINEEGEEEEIEEEEEEEEEEEDEGNEEKNEGIGAVVNWTEDDQKNLLYLGTSEMERNQRLENLIAKRKAKKFLSFHYTEKNLIDLDISDNNQMMPTASALRRNLSDIRFQEDTLPHPSTSVIKPKPKRIVSFNLPDEKEKVEATCKEKDLPWVAPSNLAFVDEVEARSKEINEISERDVISLDDLSPPVFTSEEDDKVENASVQSVQNVQNPKPSTPRSVPNLFTRSRVIKSSEDFPAILEENNMEMLIMDDDDFNAVDGRENECEVDDDEVKEEDDKKKSEHEAENDAVKEEEEEEVVDKEEKNDECEGKDVEVNVEDREEKSEGEATKNVGKSSGGIMGSLRMGKIKNITKIKFNTKSKSKHTEQ